MLLWHCYVCLKEVKYVLIKLNEIQHSATKLASKGAFDTSSVVSFLCELVDLSNYVKIISILNIVIFSSKHHSLYTLT